MGSHSDSTWCIIWIVCRRNSTGKFSKVKLLFGANKSQLKLTSKTGFISFPLLGKPIGLNIVWNSNAAYASIENGSPRSGFIIFICNRMNKMAPICWSSKKLDWVTKRPLTPETFAFSETAEAGISIAAMLQKIFRLPGLPEESFVKQTMYFW